MVNQIYTAIAKKLEELFDEPLIYFDPLPQTFKGPCSWVRLLKAEQNQLLYNRYKVNLDFDIMMYPSNDEEFIEEPNSVDTELNSVDTELKSVVKELNSVGTELLHGIEYIVTEDGNYLRGTNISYEVQDGVLHFFISYILFTIVPYDRGVKMNKLIQQYKYKG